MKKIIPSEIGLKAISNFITSAVVPRPIAFVSTINQNGQANLSPFSFFNAFSSDPPILIFSAAKSALTGKQKDTYHNVKANAECVIHIANYAMVEQLICYQRSVSK
jgi:flavin reductase (DIM6/NTAB) family NADH-FMN oxidoreductase RutF